MWVQQRFKKTHLDDPTCLPGNVQKLSTGTEETSHRSFLWVSERQRGQKRRLSQTLRSASVTPSHQSENSQNHLLEEQRGSECVCVCVCVCDFCGSNDRSNSLKKHRELEMNDQKHFFLTSISMEHKVTKGR